jgi:signal transduction histidine kinase
LRRISAELHDGPAQDLGLVLLRLDQVIAHSENSPTENGDHLREELGGVKSSVQAALQEVRAISGGLGLPDLDRLTLSETLTRVVKTHQRRTGTQVVTTFNQLPEQVPLPVKITIYRIIQEALSNAFRHAQGLGQAVGVTATNDRIEIEVSDRGSGFKHETANDEIEHLGLVGMRQRVESLGGSFKIESEPGQGTRVCAWLPLTTHEGIDHHD